MRISDWSSDVCSSDLPGDDLVRIALVADVPDDLVARRVEHIVERGRQLDDAESRSQMPARRPHRRTPFGAQFVGELAEVFGVQLSEGGGALHRVEQTRMRTTGHRADIKINADSF